MIRETSPLHLLPSGSEVNVNAIYKIFLFYCNELKAEASCTVCTLRFANEEAKKIILFELFKARYNK